MVLACRAHFDFVLTLAALPIRDRGLDRRHFALMSAGAAIVPVQPLNPPARLLSVEANLATLGTSAGMVVERCANDDG